MVERQTNGDGELPLERETYLEERKLLIDAEREAARSFDKAMITLCAAALGLSISFVRYVAPVPKATTLLYVAWVCFVLALIVTLFSFLTAQSAMRKQRAILDRYCGKELSEGEKRNRWATCTKWLNVSSIILFISGVVFLVCFSVQNL
jgi:hypothetical protein